MMVVTNDKDIHLSDFRPEPQGASSMTLTGHVSKTLSFCHSFDWQSCLRKLQRNYLAPAPRKETERKGKGLGNLMIKWISKALAALNAI